MKEKQNFLKWLLWIVLIITGLIIAEKSFHVFTYIYSYDNSKFGTLLFVLFWIMSIQCGWLMWQLESIEKKVENGIFNPAYFSRIKKIELDSVWISHVVDIATPIGFLGTVVGFIFVVNVLKTYNIETQAQTLIWELAKGAYTALMTTGVGLVVFVLLGTEEILLKKAISEKKNGK